MDKESPSSGVNPDCVGPVISFVSWEISVCMWSVSTGVVLYSVGLLVRGKSRGVVREGQCSHRFCQGMISNGNNNNLKKNR